MSILHRRPPPLQRRNYPARIPRRHRPLQLRAMLRPILASFHPLRPTVAHHRKLQKIQSQPLRPRSRRI
ncbi:hypothetical protein BDD12DRAFT_820852 [Trichophaea hybrida]|nr:hypothetical protein BDD12DRAFT_820852 [Trichophaea hybrida]